jgi:hypothetical protein
MTLPHRRARRRERGYSLIEISFAVLVLGVGLVGLFGIFPVSIQWANQTSTALTGGHIARGVVAELQEKLSLSDDGDLSDFDGKVSGQDMVVHYKVVGGGEASPMYVYYKIAEGSGDTPSGIYSLTLYLSRVKFDENSDNDSDSASWDDESLPWEDVWFKSGKADGLRYIAAEDDNDLTEDDLYEPDADLLAVYRTAITASIP